MSNGRYYISPICVTYNKNKVIKNPTQKGTNPRNSIKNELSNSNSKVHSKIYYTNFSQYTGYGAAATAWCGVNYHKIRNNH